MGTHAFSCCDVMLSHTAIYEGTYVALVYSRTLDIYTTAHMSMGTLDMCCHTAIYERLP